MSTSDRPRIPSADELLRHAPWMRALARSLVLDDATADDVTQDAWVVALEHPPRATASLGGWLATVVRSLVARRARGESRRRARERAAAATEALESTDDVVARAGIHRRLVDAVLALDEPYRSTLLLRFFDGLPPRAIAERKGLNDATVRTHLKRGLDRLRERFDAEHGGDRRAWLAALAPLVGPALPGGAVVAAGATITAAATGKAVLMSSTTKLALAAAIVVAAGAGWLAMRRDSTAKSSRTGDAAGRDDVRPVAAEATTAARPIAAPASPTGTTPDGTTPKRTIEAAPAESVHFVYGALVDTDGEPVRDVYVGVSSRAANDDVVPSRARPWDTHEDNGSFAIAGLTPGSWQLHASAAGFGSVSRDFTLDGEAEGKRVDLVFRRQLKIPIRLRAPDGRALVDAVSKDDPDVPLFHLAVIALSDSPPARLPMTSGCTYDGWSLARWHSPSNGPFVRAGVDDPPVPKEVDGLLLFDRARPFHAVATWKNVVVAQTFVADPEHLERPVELVVDPAAITAALATVRVRCVNGDANQAAAGLPLCLRDAQNWGQATVKTDADGLATFTRVAPGLLTFEFGLLEFLAPVEPGGVTDLGTIDVKPAPPVQGRVVDEHGLPLKGGVAWIDVGRWKPGELLDYCTSTACDQNGVFRLMLGRSRYLLRSGGPEHAFAPLLVDLTNDTVEPIEIRVVPGTLVTFDPANAFPLLPTSFEITRADGSIVDSSGGLREIRLVPGPYRLTVRRDGAILATTAFDVGNSPLRVPVPALPGPVRDDPGHDVSAAGVAANEFATASKRGTDPVGLVLYGRIAGAKGRGFDEGWFTAINAANERRDTRLHRDCFALAGLTAGRTELLVNGSSRLPYREWLDVASSSAPIRHNFQLAPALQIAIALVDARTRKPLEWHPDRTRRAPVFPHFKVVASKAPLADGSSMARANANDFSPIGVGRFRSNCSRMFPEFERYGTLEIDGELPVFVSLVSGGHVLHCETLAAPVPKLELPVDWDAVRADDCSLRVRLVDTTSGAPLEPTVFAIAAIDYGSDTNRNDAKRLDHDGTYEIAGLAAGECNLVIVVPGHERIEHSLTLAPGVVNDLGTLELSAAREVHGRVVDADGRPVQCTLSVRDVGRGERSLPLFGDQRVWSGNDGAFSFALGGGVHELSIEDERYAATSRRLDPASGQLDDLHFVMRPGVPVAIRLDPPTEICDAITIEDENGVQVASRRYHGFLYRLRLAPGRYVARGRNGLRECGVVDFEVVSAPLEVVLNP
jgi:RNA polymerase sigma factor (sigma-70 family)